MQKGAPSVAKIITMVLFALSCVGLLLFLWLSFGGTIPFNPQGYQVRISFPYAGQLAQEADVRIAGVSVGKVIQKSLDPQGNRTIATVAIDKQYAPLRQDAVAILRLKTILGETYIEVAPGSSSAKPIPDGGLVKRSNVVAAVQLDQVFSAFDPKTRQDFQIWQQSLAKAIAGNDQNLNSVLGNLPQFAADATDITRVLDIQHAAVVSLLQNGAVVFGAISQDQAALRSLINTGETTFATTAAQNTALADTFHVFPTFLNESKATFTRLKSFSLDADPVIKELIPVAQDLGPTLAAVRTLSPDLLRLFVKLGPLITVSQTGLPAYTDVLNGARPLLGQLGPFLEQLNPILYWLSLHQQLISDFISNGATGTAARTVSFSGNGNGHYLRQFGPVGPETLGFYANRDSGNRGNTYPQPIWLSTIFNAGGNFKGDWGLPGWDCTNTGAAGNGATGSSTAPVGSHPACWPQPPLGNLIGQKQAFPQIPPAKYSSK